jgi:1-acyl-sn-glycerol-3-phosphate acyltransferase
MDYMEKFFSKDGLAKKLSLKDKLSLTHEMGMQLFREVWTSYQNQLTDSYVSESEMLTWLDNVSQTPAHKLAITYFNPKLHNIERLPKEGGLIVTNHTTMFLADVLPVLHGVYEKRHRIVYGLFHRVFGESDMSKTLIGAPGKRDVAIKMLKEGKYLLVCPEGIYGACRPFYNPHKIIREEGFKKMGYIDVAREANVPIIPIGNVGASETMINLGNMKKPVSCMFGWHKRISRMVKVSKIVPMPINLLPLPSSVDAYIGDPIYISKQDSNLEINEMVINCLDELITNGLKERRKLPDKIRGRILILCGRNIPESGM